MRKFAAAAALVAAAVLYSLNGTPVPSTWLPGNVALEAEPVVGITTADVDVAAALAQLSTLEVKGRAPKTGYDRAEFGNGWATESGCDVRNRILARDLAGIELDPGGCLVMAGILNDPYTGEVILFQRGPDTSGQVHVDHVVALSDGWQKGAQAWSPAERVVFANDPANLLAVSAAANQAKGDGDAATWLPPNRSFRCRFVAIQIGVKHSYQLWVTPAERDAMARVLSRC